MNILFLSTDDNLGAGTSVFRIAKTLSDAEYECTMLVKNKTRSDNIVIAFQDSSSLIRKAGRKILKKIKAFIFPPLSTDPNYYFFNTRERDFYIPAKELIKHLKSNPDIIIVGWVSTFINTKTLWELNKQTGAKVYFLMTDMSPLTGGCHYAWNCKGYQNNCSNCPAILNPKQKQQARNNLRQKEEFIHKADIKVIAGSYWTQIQAKSSLLFRNQKNIPVLNGIIDPSIFNNLNRDHAKMIFNIPKDTKLIFTGATFTTEKRKGIEFLVKALKVLKVLNSKMLDISILIAGTELEGNELVNEVPFRVIKIDYIKDDRLLSLAYQAADVFVCSSIEDSGPMMVIEALACGTPVVGFEMGHIMKMVKDGVNGYKVTPKDAEGMALALKRILEMTRCEFESFSRNSVREIEDNASEKSLLSVIQQISNE